MLIGIVGKPNVGKSTFFKALTLSDVLIANYPFATIDANKGVGHVRVKCPAENFFNVKCNPRHGYCIDGERFVPVELIDVAGIVPGAHDGKGMGNQFLDDLRQADVLIHVVDASGSTNNAGEPVEPGTHDPKKDVKFLEDELDYWYLGILKKGWERFARQIKQEHGNIVISLYKQLSGLKVSEDDVKDAIKKLNLGEDPTKWSDEELLNLARFFRKRTKPIVIAANKMDLIKDSNSIKDLGENVIPVYADGELALKQASKANMIKYISGDNTFEINGNLNNAQREAIEKIKKTIEKNNGTGVQETMNYAVFDLLKYIAIFPGGMNKLADKDGNVLPDCFLLPEGSTAYDFANKIHSDFAKNFIKAVDVKKKLFVGKDHILNNFDVIEIIANK